MGDTHSDTVCSISQVSHPPLWAQHSVWDILFSHLQLSLLKHSKHFSEDQWQQKKKNKVQITTSVPPLHTFLLQLPQCRGPCVHPSHTWGIWTADRCGSGSPAACCVCCRCSPGPWPRPESGCVSWAAAPRSAAAGGSHSRRPSTRDRTCKLFFSSPCMRHTTRHQVLHRCHLHHRHFCFFPPCAAPAGRPGACSSWAQASGRKSPCTAGSCTSLRCRCFCPRTRWRICYSNYVRTRSSRDPPVTVNKRSSLTVDARQPCCQVFQDDWVSFIFPWRRSGLMLLSTVALSVVSLQKATLPGAHVLGRTPRTSGQGPHSQDCTSAGLQVQDEPNAFKVTKHVAHLYNDTIIIIMLYNNNLNKDSHFPNHSVVHYPKWMWWSSSTIFLQYLWYVTRLVYF